MAEVLLDEDEDFDSSAMAAAMGFSSFGGPASKKRKFNPRADAAFVASSSPSSSAPAPAPSGANTTALGERPPRAPPEALLPMHASSAGLPARPSRDVSSLARQQNSDEIALDDDDDDAADPEPQYIDTSRPARRLSFVEREAREVQEQIDAIVTAKVDETMAQAQGGAGLPVLPPPGMAVAPGVGYGQRHHHGGQHAERGAPGHIWWEDYHDPSFNQNPWEWLEKTRGLAPRGTWIPRVAKSG